MTVFCRFTALSIQASNESTIMTINISAHDVETQIAGDIAACEALLELLDKEKEALGNKDAEVLASVVEAKIEPLTQLENSARQRAMWANISSQDQAGEQWNQFLSELNQEKLKEDWEKLKSLTHECHKKNEINGKIIGRSRQVYGRLMDMMRGQVASPNLYTANGKATSSRSSIRVDEA